MRVILLTGKGGVGKTTLAAATAMGAAQHGHRVFLLSTDAAHNLGDAFGRPIGPRPVSVAPDVTAQEVAVLEELDRSWSEIERWFRELLEHGGEELVAEELMVFPGLEELIALRAVREVEQAGEHDVCVVDCAPTGATLRMLRFPDALRIFMGDLFAMKRRATRAIRPVADRVGLGWLTPRDEVFAAFERLYTDVDDVRQILMDEDRTTARLVTNPARVVVDETRRSFAYLCLYGVSTDAVVVNRLLPELAADGWFARWAERERGEMESIEASFPVPLLRAPLHPKELVGAEALRDLGAEVYGERDPAAILHRGRPVRLRREDEEVLLEIDLPHVEPGDVDVVAHGPDLLVNVRDAHRRVSLPDSVVGRSIRGSELRDGVLRVRLGP